MGSPNDPVSENKTSKSWHILRITFDVLLIALLLFYAIDRVIDRFVYVPSVDRCNELYAQAVGQVGIDGKTVWTPLINESNATGVGVPYG